MNIFKEKFKIIIVDNSVDIQNYSSIEHIDDNKIIIKADKTVLISGKSMTLKRLLDDEILRELTIQKLSVESNLDINFLKSKLPLSFETVFAAYTKGNAGAWYITFA